MIVRSCAAFEPDASSFVRGTIKKPAGTSYFLTLSGQESFEIYLR